MDLSRLAMSDWQSGGRGTPGTMESDIEPIYIERKNLKNLSKVDWLNSRSVVANHSLAPPYPIKKNIVTSSPAFQSFFLNKISETYN